MSDYRIIAVPQQTLRKNIFEKEIFPISAFIMN